MSSALLASNDYSTCSFSSQDCISLGSGEPNTSEYRSFVLYHNNSPRWSEMVKLPIPIDRFRGSHLRFEFRHCSSESLMQWQQSLSAGFFQDFCHHTLRSCKNCFIYAMMCFLLAKDKGEKKLFGFAFTPLMREDGTTLSDESHELYVYKVCRVLTHTVIKDIHRSINT